MRRLSLLLLFALACGDDDSPPPGDGGLPSDDAAMDAVPPSGLNKSIATPMYPAAASRRATSRM